MADSGAVIHKGCLSCVCVTVVLCPADSGAVIHKGCLSCVCVDGDLLCRTAQECLKSTRLQQTAAGGSGPQATCVQIHSLRSAAHRSALHGTGQNSTGQIGIPRIRFHGTTDNHIQKSANDKAYQMKFANNRSAYIRSQPPAHTVSISSVPTVIYKYLFGKPPFDSSVPHCRTP